MVESSNQPFHVLFHFSRECFLMSLQILLPGCIPRHRLIPFLRNLPLQHLQRPRNLLKNMKILPLQIRLPRIVHHLLLFDFLNDLIKSLHIGPIQLVLRDLYMILKLSHPLLHKPQRLHRSVGELVEFSSALVLISRE